MKIPRRELTGEMLRIELHLPDEWVRS